MREEAQLRGYTVVDAATVISTHLTEVIKNNTADLLSFVEVQKLLKELPKEHQDLLKEIVPTQISTTGIQRVMQLLLAERVSIRDLGAILEAISEIAGARSAPDHRACALASGTSALRAAHRAAGAPADHHDVTGLGRCLRAVDHR
jgi:flagellar biosynthesis protein FlhA